VLLACIDLSYATASRGRFLSFKLAHAEQTWFGRYHCAIGGVVVVAVLMTVMKMLV